MRMRGDEVLEKSESLLAIQLPLCYGQVSPRDDDDSGLEHSQSRLRQFSLRYTRESWFGVYLMFCRYCLLQFGTSGPREAYTGREMISVG